MGKQVEDVLHAQEPPECLHSIKRNMHYLWTFEELYGLGIPNTNNGIESVFADLKSILRLHKGISMNTRKTIILEYFYRLNADE